MYAFFSDFICFNVCAVCVLVRQDTVRVPQYILMFVVVWNSYSGVVRWYIDKAEMIYPVVIKLMFDIRYVRSYVFFKIDFGSYPYA